MVHFIPKIRPTGGIIPSATLVGAKSCPPFLFEREFVLKDRKKNEMDLHECTRDGVNSYIFDLNPGFYELTIHLISHDRHGKQDEMLTIMVEDNPIFGRIDYLEEAGQARAFDLRALVETIDGSLNIEFLDTRGNHEVSAIGVRNAHLNDITPPPALTSVEAVDTYGGVLFRFDRIKETDFAEYRILRRVDKDWEVALVRRIPMAVVPAQSPAEYALVAVDIYGNTSDTTFVGEIAPRDFNNSPYPRYEIFIEPEWMHDLNYRICENTSCDIKVPGTLIVNGEVFENVDFSYRGSAQLRAPKKSWNVKSWRSSPIEWRFSTSTESNFC